MPAGNALVAAILRSPLHRVLSGAVGLVRYEGRRSGRTFTTPIQYALPGDGRLVIMVGQPEAKRWWRNFVEPHDLEVLVRGTWRPMRGVAVRGAADPSEARALLDAYVARFPKAGRTLGEGSEDDRIARAVLVRCDPRPA